MLPRTLAIRRAHVNYREQSGVKNDQVVFAWLCLVLRAFSCTFGWKVNGGKDREF